MEQLGKTIRIYLANGKPSGVKIAEIINWTGRVFVCPKANLDKLARQEDVKRPGIYVLVGDDPEHLSKQRVYIGETDNVFTRLKNHLDEDQDYWTQTVVIVSKDENLTKAHVGYLESRLIELAEQTDYAFIENKKGSSPNPLPQPDIDNMEYFLEQLKIILPILGFNFLKPRQKINLDQKFSSPTFILESVGAKAKAKEIDEEFIVLKRSTARIKGAESWESYVDLREQLVEENKLSLSEEEGYYIFTENVAFNSPSAAAAVICATNINGPITWKIEGSNKTYKEWKKETVEWAENE